MKIEELNKKQSDHERYLKNREKIIERSREWKEYLKKKKGKQK